ncbi:Glutamine amidotransferase, class I [uncultured Gammaproteobacteria bacterium]|jgi:GMP synthase-like glutamine amidotransferase|nr:Glutamine amidotransferase, class I [uncultured Gammaproteobacteria bacterium]CAC9577298.1 Glutamine amidotransferase, class I [uncultured Gammaproteobacteria bacterium]CAC9590326.1 Glutamine amidotransferase, class I [uncultured Gammaproteobacteria bacterium]CAC9989135.1 Glutamine amidotransferase, class I [uncultured Gammaproteobacteria bacterium]
MRIHYLQHVEYEGLGSIKSWMLNNGCEITGTHFYESTQLPNPEEVDMLIILGGPMSVNDENAYNWMVSEKVFIRNMIDIGKVVLGICLGAQLISDVLGSTVFTNHTKEIGWFPVKSTSAENVFELPDELIVFQWHGETFNLPKGAIRLSTNTVCKNQAFQIGKNIIGLQFHLEVTENLVSNIVSNCADELIRSKDAQGKNEILSMPVTSYDLLNDSMGKVLDYLYLNSNIGNYS